MHPKLTVIEFDRDLIAPLTAAAEPLGELTIVHRDVLRVDFTELAAGQPIRLSATCPTTSPRRSCSMHWNMPR